MRHAILTKHLPATTCRGTRVRASSNNGNVTMNWQYDLSVEANHIRAARILSQRHGWHKFNKYISGEMPSTSPYAYCFVAVPLKDKTNE